MGTVVANSSWGPEVTDPPHADLSAGRGITRGGILIPQHITSCWKKLCDAGRGVGWAGLGGEGRMEQPWGALLSGGDTESQRGMRPEQDCL